jgi:hypothetical protein
MRTVILGGMLLVFGVTGLLPAAQPNASAHAELLPGAQQMAANLGLLPQLARLEHLQTQPPSAANALETLLVHQQITEALMRASLQLDATLAQIDNEISQAKNIEDYLTDRRDHQVNRLNLASVAAGGALGVVGSALQLSARHVRAGTVTSIAAGSVASTLSIIGLHAQRGRAEQFSFPSNMLAQLFDRPAEPNSSYPPTVWTFLNAIAPTDPNHLSRKDRLIRTWTDVERMEPADTKEGRDKIDRMTSMPGQNYRLSIDDFGDRVAMLQDVRAKLSFMKRDLESVLNAVPALSPDLLSGTAR